MKCFYFYDCPRTGGTSFKRWSKHVRELKRVRYRDNKDWHHVPFRPRSEISKLAPTDADLFTFTFLRDPAEHTASLFSKIITHKHAFRSKLEKISFHNWIYGDFQCDRATAPPPWGFSMVRFYDPESGDVDRAIENIESMDFVGFTDRLNGDMEILLKLGEIKKEFDGSHHNKAHRGFTISEDDRKHILKIRADDLKLVNHFRLARKLEPYG